MVNKANKNNSKETGPKKLGEQLQEQKKVLQKLLTEIEKDNASNLKNK